MKWRWWGFTLVLLVLFTFRRAYFAGYVLWDDDALIANNMVLKMPFFQALETAFSIFYHGDYFPLTLMSYWTDYNIFGEVAHPQHLINLAFQVANVVLLLVFFLKFTKNNLVILLAPLIFAIHPLQTETVMWISERKSLLSAFFSFLALVFYLKSHEESRPRLYFGLALASFLVACLAKATTVLLPVIFAALDYRHFGWDWKRLLKRFSAPAVVALLLSAARFRAYAVSVQQVESSMWNVERLMYLPLTALNAIGFYIKKFFWPFNFAAMYPNFELSTSVYVTSALVFLFLAFVVYRIWKTRDSELLFYTLWFILFLLPVLQIIPRINYVNDRYMYLPIVGFVGILLKLYDWQTLIDSTRPKVVRAVFAILILFMVQRSYSASKVWELNRTLWENTLFVFPECAIAHNNLALDYQKQEEWDRTVFHYKLIIDAAAEPSNRLLAYNNLANVFSNPKYPGYNLATATQLIQEGLKLVTALRESFELRTNLGILLYKQNRYYESRKVFEAILQDLDREPDYRFNWLREMATKMVQQQPPPTKN